MGSFSRHVFVFNLLVHISEKNPGAYFSASRHTHNYICDTEVSMAIEPTWTCGIGPSISRSYQLFDRSGENAVGRARLDILRVLGAAPAINAKSEAATKHQAVCLPRHCGGDSGDASCRVLSRQATHQEQSATALFGRGVWVLGWYLDLSSNSWLMFSIYSSILSISCARLGGSEVGP